MPLRDRLRAFFQPPTPPTAPDLSEVAVADPRRWDLFAIGSPVYTINPDDLVGKKSLKIYDEMRTDDQVTACLSLKKAAVVWPGWRLDPAGKDVADQELADTLKKDLEHLEEPLEDVLWEMLSALDYGFSIAEKLWSLDERLHLSAIKVRAPHWMDFIQTPGGDVETIIQRQGQKIAEMDPRKFVHFLNKPEFSNPYSVSDLRPAHRPWFFKKHWMQWWAIYGERFAIPTATGHHPKQADPQKVQSFLNTLKNLQANTSLTVEDGWLVELLESKRDPKLVFEGAVDRMDLAISKAMLMPDKSGLAGGGVKEGSLALAQEQANTFLFVLGLLARRLERKIQQDVIVEMARYEAPGRPPPIFHLNPLTEENKHLIADVWTRAVTGQAVVPTPDDENHLRVLLGFPERDVEDQAAGQPLQRGVVGGARERGAPGNATSVQDKTGQPAASKQLPPLQPQMRARDRLVLSAEPGFWRTLTPLEQRANMAEKRQTFDALTPAVAQVVAGASAAMVAAIRDQIVAAGLNLPSASPTAIARLDVPAAAVAHFIAPLAGSLNAAYRRGATDAQSELKRAKKRVKMAQDVGLVGQQAADFFQARALTVTGVLSDEIKKKAQNVLLGAVKNDKTPRQVLFELDQALGDYLPDSDAQGNIVNVPARIEVIARTNTAEAVNEGRYAAFTDPDLQGLVSSFTYSAVLDDRTTEYCRAWDKVTRPVDDPVWYGPPDRRPPNHYNCRSVLIPVTVADQAEETPDDQLPDINPPEGFK